MAEIDQKGIWATYDRIMRLLFPVALAWCIWVTDRVQSSPHELREWVRDNFPPNEMKTDLKDVKESLRNMEVKLGKLEVQLIRVNP